MKLKQDKKQLFVWIQLHTCHCRRTMFHFEQIWINLVVFYLNQSSSFLFEYLSISYMYFSHFNETLRTLRHELIFTTTSLNSAVASKTVFLKFEQNILCMAIYFSATYNLLFLVFQQSCQDNLVCVYSL